MMELLIHQYPHQRYNPLMGEWVLVSPQRTERPWLGQIEKSSLESLPSYDPHCYLCPGNERAGGVLNPNYDSTFVFTNDFPALLPDAPAEKNKRQSALFNFQFVRGTCRVICFSPRHDLTLPEMQQQDIRQVVDIWGEQTAELGADHTWVQVFENKGAIMGSSNPHPHGQIWAMDTIPNQPAREHLKQREYTDVYGNNMLLDYLGQELSYQVRIVFENDDWVVLVPYWAFWPFETMVLPRRHVLRLPDLQQGERDTLAELIKHLLTLYDNLFETSFPYSMGWHGAPFLNNGEAVDHWQLHAHFYPPLLRSATIKKFMVGFELLAQAQRDLTAEQAAARLRELPSAHYKDRK